MNKQLIDTFGRIHDYLRISVTDRCNLRCGYCMPPEGINHIKKKLILSYEELLRILRVGISLGINKVRITGGEPLIRSGVVGFIREISALDGLQKIGLTTNGLQLQSKLNELRDTRLSHINVSLDSLDDDRFQDVTGGGDVDTVLAAIKGAVETGFHVKVNVVVLPDLDWHEIRRLINLARELGITVRFIEFMPLCGSGWDSDQFTPLSYLKLRIRSNYLLQPVEENGVANTYRFASGSGQVGFIASLSDPFCDSCSRLRLSSTGTLYSCLFSPEGVHLLPILRSGGTDRDIAQKLIDSVNGKWAGNPAYTGQWDPETENPPQDFALIRSIGG